MRLSIIILVLAFPGAAFGQSISMAPSSFKAWGATKSTIMFSMDYKAVSLHYLQSYSNQLDPLNSPVTQQTFAMSVKPINIRDIVRVGVIAFQKPFPTPNSTRLNAWIEIGYSFLNGRISYVHISNAYTGCVNMGMDAIQISIDLH